MVAAWIAFGVRPDGPGAGGHRDGDDRGGGRRRARRRSGAAHAPAGDALVLGAVVLFGVYVAFARGLREAMPARPYAACVYGVAALALAPLVFVFDAHITHVHPSTWLAIAALGLVPTLVGHTLVQRAARHVSPSLVALVSPGETAGAILIGAATGHMPTPLEWTGAGIIVAGACITVMGART